MHSLLRLSVKEWNIEDSYKVFILQLRNNWDQQVEIREWFEELFSCALTEVGRDWLESSFETNAVCCAFHAIWYKSCTFSRRCKWKEGSDVGLRTGWHHYRPRFHDENSAKLMFCSDQFCILQTARPILLRHRCLPTSPICSATLLICSSTLPTYALDIFEQLPKNSKLRFDRSLQAFWAVPIGFLISSFSICLSRSGLLRRIYLHHIFCSLYCDTFLAG